MLNWTLGEIAAHLGNGTRVVAGKPYFAVSGISTDSRTVSHGDLFVALQGERHDGHAFIAEARRRGAVAALVSEPVDLPESPELFGLVRNADTLRALGELARKRRDELSLRWIAVTGSAGKSTTKEMIAHLLAARGPVLHAKASFNNQVGVPLTIFQAGRKHEVAVLELGTDRPGEIARLTEICRPEIGVITNIGPAHLERLGRTEGVAAEKSALMAALPGSGLAVLPAECNFLAQLADRATAPVVTFGVTPAASVNGRVIASTPGGGLAFMLNGTVPVRLPIPGKHNVRNALAATAVALELGMSEREIAGRLASFQPLAMRTRIETIGGVTLIDDSYNANPLAFAAALETLGAFPDPRRRVVIAGDMLELGEAAADWHRRLGREVAQLGVGRFITIGSLSREASRAAMRAGLASWRVEHYADAFAASEVVEGSLREGEVVLVKGSRRMWLDHVAEAVRRFGRSRVRKAS